jgi:hypothetical protein
VGFLDDLKNKASRIYDQANPFDNGRTWQQRTPIQVAPQPSPVPPPVGQPPQYQSAVHQVTHNGATNAAGSFLNNLTGIPSAIDAGRLGVAELTHNQPAIDNATLSLNKNLPRTMFVGAPLAFKQGFGQDVATAVTAPAANAAAQQQADYARRIFGSTGQGDPLYQNDVDAYASALQNQMLNEHLARSGVTQDTSPAQIYKKAIGGGVSTLANMAMFAKLPGVGTATNALKVAPTYGALNATATAADMVANDPTATPKDYAKNVGLAFGMGAGLPLAVAGSRFAGNRAAAANDAYTTALNRYLASRPDIVANMSPAQLKQAGFLRMPGQKTELMVTHNLSKDNLAHADELGGIPQASVGIVDPKKYALDGFGDITLIGNQRLVDPKAPGTRTYASDVYSPRQPRGDYLADKENITAIRNELGPSLKEYGNGYLNLDHGDNLTEGLADSPAVMGHYLQSKGMKPDFTPVKSQYEQARDMRNQIIKAGKEEDYNAFVDQLVHKSGAQSRIFAGWTPSGNKRLLPETMDNVLKVMRKEGQRGADNWGGIGNIRAKVVPRFTSLQDIVKAKGRLTPTEQMDAAKEVIENRATLLRSKLDKYATDKDSNQFMEFDRQMEAISDYLSGNRQWFDSKFQNVPPAMLKELDTFKKELQEAPTEYFESVSDRGVRLSEFEKALVPEGTDPQTVALLKKHGVEPVVYKEGQRQQALQDLMAKDNAARTASRLKPEQMTGELKTLAARAKDFTDPQAFSDSLAPTERDVIRRVYRRDGATDHDAMTNFMRDAQAVPAPKKNLTSSLDAQKYPDFKSFYKDYKPFFDDNGFGAKEAESVYNTAVHEPITPIGTRGTRVSSSAQTQFEQAYNSGDMATAKKFAEQIQDPTSRQVALDSVNRTTTKKDLTQAVENPTVKAMIERAQANKAKVTTVNGYHVHRPDLKGTLSTEDALIQTGLDSGWVDQKDITKLTPSQQDYLKKSALGYIGAGDPVLKDRVEFYAKPTPVAKQATPNIFTDERGSLGPAKLPVAKAKANGDAYEATLANALRKQGGKVTETGKTAGRQDGGVDLIHKRPDGTTELIQAKFRSRDTTIHLGTLAQIDGAAARYRAEHPGETVQPAVYATKPFDADALAYAKSNGVKVVQTGLKGEKVAQQKPVAVKPTGYKITDIDKVAIQNSIPAADRADFLSQLANKNSDITKRLSTATPDTARQIVRRYYEGKNPFGSFELNQAKAVGAKLAKASTPAEVQKIIGTGNTTLMKTLREASKDKTFAKQLVDTRTKSGIRALINSKLKLPIYEPIDGGGAPPKPPKVVNAQPLPDGRKPRQFAETVKNSPHTLPESKAAIEARDTSYTPKSNKVLLAQARAAIGKDYDAAYKMATTEGSDKAVATAGELIKLHQARGEFEQVAQIADKAARNLTELGRGVQAASLYNRISPQGIVRYAAKQAGKQIAPSVAEQLTRMAEAIAKMPDGEAKAIATHQMLELARQQKTSPIAHQLIDVWKAGLLTAPTTHLGNILSNTVEALTKDLLVNPVATGIDAALHYGSFGKLKRSRSLTARGGVSGTIEGTRRAGTYTKTGYDPRNPLTKYELGNKTVFGHGPLGKAARVYTESVFRVLGAEDQPFYYKELRNSMYDRAITAAKNEGVKGAEHDAFVEHFVKEPPIDAVKGAAEDARRSVFANKTMLGQRAANLKRDSAVGSFVVPFSQVPASIATRILERSPVGVLQAANDVVRGLRHQGFDQRAFTEHLANAAVGTAGAVVVGKALSDNQMISLGYPNDQKEKARWKAERRTPYSIKMGPKWVSLNYVQPFGSILAYGAAYTQARQNGASPAQASAAAAAQAAKSVTSQSFLQGVSGTLQAIQQPEQKAADFMNSTAGSLIPNAVRSFARAQDDKQRQVNTVPDAIKNGVPSVPGLPDSWKRKSLIPQVDTYGRDVGRPAGPGARGAADSYLNPLRTSQIQGSPVQDEVNRLHATAPGDTKMDVQPTPVDRTLSIGGVKTPLNTAQQTDLQRLVGQATYTVWDSLIKTPEYQSLPDDQKVKALNNARDDATELAQRQFAVNHNIAIPDKAKLTKQQINVADGTFSAADYATKQKMTATKASLPKTPKAKTFKPKATKSTKTTTASRKRTFTDTLTSSKIALTGSLTKKAAGTKVSAPKVASSMKGRGIKAFKKGTTSKIAIKKQLRSIA